MTIENYCMVNEQTNICENVTLWDGDPQNWTPPSGYLMFPQNTTPAKDWVFNPATNTWELSVMGVGQIGFMWDGTYLVTQEPIPQPTQTQPTESQPIVSGAQTL